MGKLRFREYRTRTRIFSAPPVLKAMTRQRISKRTTGIKVCLCTWAHTHADRGGTTTQPEEWVQSDRLMPAQGLSGAMQCRSKSQGRLLITLLHPLFYQHIKETCFAQGVGRGPNKLTINLRDSSPPFPQSAAQCWTPLSEGLLRTALLAWNLLLPNSIPASPSQGNRVREGLASHFLQACLLCLSWICPNSKVTLGLNFPTSKTKGTKNYQTLRNASTMRDKTRDKKELHRNQKMQKTGENLKILK